MVGDYAKQFADDEEEHVGAAQQLLEQGEARVAEHDLSAGGSLGEVRVDKDGRVVALAVDGTGDYLGKLLCVLLLGKELRNEKNTAQLYWEDNDKL